MAARAGRSVDLPRPIFKWQPAGGRPARARSVRCPATVNRGHGSGSVPCFCVAGPVQLEDDAENRTDRPGHAAFAERKPERPWRVLRGDPGESGRRGRTCPRGKSRIGKRRSRARAWLYRDRGNYRGSNGVKRDPREIERSFPSVVGGTPRDSRGSPFGRNPVSWPALFLKTQMGRGVIF